MANFYTAHDIYKSQRSERGLAYENKLKSLAMKRRAGDVETKHLVEQVVDEVMRTKAGPNPGAVHQNTFLSNMSLQYANDDYIGERLLPVVSVGKRSDSYATYSKRDRLAAPSDAIGPRGEANEVSETRGSANYSVLDYALQNFVPAETIDNQDAVFDEMMDLVDAVNDGLAFNREIRCATVLTTAGNYSGNTATLAGSDQWNSASGGDPIKNIQDAIAALYRGFGQTDLIAFCGLDVFNCLARHPAILDLLKYQRSGLARREEIAQLFGFTELLVGGARKDTANIGQTASYSRIWGDDFGIVRVARRPTKRSAHFGTTFRLQGDPQTFEWFDPKKGKAGGFYAKVGLSETHDVVAGDCGYLFKDCLA